MRTASNVATKNSPATGRPTVLVLAASERSPAFEAQMRILEEQAEDFHERGIVVGCVLQEGESRLGTVRMERAEAREILDRHLTDGKFQIVVLTETGEEVHRADAPLQGAAILRALDSDAA